MMVTFITETPPQTAPVPPPPPEPAKPRPQPKMIATPKPTPSAISEPPIEEAPVVDAPVDDTPPAPQVQAAPAAVIPPEFVAAYLHNPGPRYPSSSIRMREQGTVMLLVLRSEEHTSELQSLMRISYA